jgi:PAS domain-containing protein
MSAASLMLGTIHLFAWKRYRLQPAHLLFFLLAASATAFGVFELAMMQASSAANYASTLRWAHVPQAMFVLFSAWFVHFHLAAGRLWLAWTATGLRLLGLALNFLTGANINFSDVSTLNPVTLWGGAVVFGPVGIPNPLAIVPQIGNLLLVVYVVDAALTLWRRGAADALRRAAVVGGGFVICIVAVAGFAALITLGLVRAPTILTPGFFIVVLAMAYKLGWDLIAAAQLTASLKASEQRFRAVVEAVPNAIILVDHQGWIALANAQAQALFGYSNTRPR